MPYSPLPRITLQGALAETNPLFDDCTCPACGGTPAPPREAIARKASTDSGKRTRAVVELIDKVARKYGG